MLATTETEIKQVIAEAQAIASGDKPDKLHDGSSASGPATGSGTAQPGDGAGPPGAAPAPSVDQLADLAILLCDFRFVRYFGGAGQLPEPFRAEARKAWVDVITKYARLVGQAGPFGALLSIYILHTVGLVMTCRTPAPLPESSANAAQEKAVS